MTTRHFTSPQMGGPGNSIPSSAVPVPVEALQSWAPQLSRYPVAQFDPATLLLETLRSVSEASRLPEALPASQVNRIGISRGFTDTELLRLLTSLSDSGEVELQWGGNLKVMRPRPTGHVIHLERGATLVQNSVIGAGAAVGSNAMAAGAVRGRAAPGRRTTWMRLPNSTAAIMLMKVVSAATRR